ncbi:MAG: heme peroxidase family protein [Kiloniellales bacterium]
MLFLLGHGQCAVQRGGDEKAVEAAKPAAAVCGASEDLAAPAAGPFRYYFPDAPEQTPAPGATAALDHLAEKMIAIEDAPAFDSSIPAIFTYLGQFIDHDITAGTDREDGLSTISGEHVRPLPREQVVRDRGNLRAGSLNLDSLYGGGPNQGTFSQRLTEMLRHPSDRSKMWIGTFFDAGLGRVPLPRDPGGDLLRLGRLLQPPHQQLHEEEIKTLPEPLRSMYVNDDGSIRVQRAIIGDTRNDENLIVAQLHLAFLRLHNRLVDHADTAGGPVGDAQAIYEWARQQLQWIYQWLVLNVYLPTICDAAIVRDTLAQEAPLYSAFFRAGKPANPDFMPMPLEFSVAAFRFGHSMVRPAYDWNRFFGRPVKEETPLLDRASFELMFAFTGNGPTPMPAPNGGSLPRLPGHWGAEWDRLASDVNGLPDRSARRIDTKLAPPLSAMANEEQVPLELFQHLARRNLRRARRLNIPSAQDCIAGIYARTQAAIEPLGTAELLSGSTFEAVRDGGFVEETPLWFYLLKEAEIQAEGLHLGQLGSRLVAETLAGLVINDPNSYWHQSGSDSGRWHPRDGVRPDGWVVDSVPALLKAALLL